MNSRERILAALACRVPDRVPISTYELVGHNTRAWENAEPSYARLMDDIREKTDCICMWNPGSDETFLATSEAVDLEEASRAEGATRVTRRVLHTRRGDLTQTTKVVDGVHTVWETERWCKSPLDVDVALSVPYEPLCYDASDYGRIRREVGNQGVIMASVSDPLLLAAELMSFGDFTVWAMTETDHFARTVELLGERVLENLRRTLEAASVDLYRICGPEYATPPFLPPRFFECFVVPYVSAMVDLIHDSGAKARLHCHGKIRQVLDLILETRADGLGPCEPPPDGDITLSEVSSRLQGRMCIFGNLELKLLEHGSAAQVEEAVRACMAAAKPNGGFVIMPTAAPIDVPLSARTEENYRRFINAALDLGQY